MSKYGVISGPYFPVLGLNTGKCGTEITFVFGHFPRSDYFQVQIAESIHHWPPWKTISYNLAPSKTQNVSPRGDNKFIQSKRKWIAKNWQVFDVELSILPTKLKSLHAQWAVDLYYHLCQQQVIMFNVFKAE